MSLSEGFRNKSQEELQSQFQSAQDVVGNEEELSLTPPSTELNEVFSLPISEIKQKYARRYEMYLQILRRKRAEGVLSEGEQEYFRKWLVALNSLDVYIEKHNSGEEKILREKQIPIFESFRDFLEAGGKKGYVKLPTGVGKTVLFSELVEALNLRTLIVVPTKLLIRQTNDRLVEFAEDLEVGKIYTSAKEYGRQVTITTYNSLVSQVNKGLLSPKDFDCVIVDEVHLSLTDKKQAVLNQFNDCLQIGFTATPEYSQDKKVGDWFDTEIYSMNIKEAVEEGLLSSFSALVAKTDVDLSKVELNFNGEYDRDQLEKAVNVAGRNKAAVDLYKQAFMGQLGVAYCVGIKHAQVVAETFNREGVPAACISGEMEDDEQENLLKDFHSGKIKVLCNADILIAGFNEERASVCFNLRPTRSKVVAEQRGGRVLRLNKEDPNKHSYVIDFIDKGIKLKRAPVLFSHIAGGAELVHKQKDESITTGGGGGGRKRLPPILDIPGLEVVTDIEEVMKIVSEFSDRGNVEKLTLTELKEELKRLGVDDSLKYDIARKQNPQWPAAPDSFYRDKGWISWLDLFGRLKLTLEELKEDIKLAGVTDYKSYKKEQAKRPNWPSNPSVFYKDKGWKSFEDLCGKAEKVSKLSIIELKEELRLLGITTVDAYKAEQKNHPSWPGQPDLFYKNKGVWVSWMDLLGKGKVSLEELKIEVRGLGIKGSTTYRKIAKQKPNWPSEPENTYKGKGWKGWSDLFDT